MRAALVVTLVALGALALFAKRRASNPPEHGSGNPRATVAAIALSQLGNKDAERYWSEVSVGAHPKTSWCAAFVLWVLRKAGLTDWTYDANGSWFYRLPATEDPDPSDLVFFPDTRHLALIDEIEDGGIWVINGAGSGGAVSRGFVSRAKLVEREAEFFSLDPLIREHAVA